MKGEESEHNIGYTSVELTDSESEMYSDDYEVSDLSKKDTKKLLPSINEGDMDEESVDQILQDMNSYVEKK